MKKFNIFNAMMKMEESEIIIPSRTKIKFNNLMERYILKVTSDYINEYITVDAGMYFDKVLQEYLDPGEIIEIALFEAWDKNKYPATKNKIQELLDNQNITDFTAQLSESIALPILKTKQKLF